MTAFPRAQDYPPAKMSRASWNAIGAVIGGPVAGNLRSEILSAADKLIVARYFAARGKASRRMLGRVGGDNKVHDASPLLSVLRTLDTLLYQWRAAVRDPAVEQTLIHYDAHVRPGHRGFTDMMGELQFHRILLRLELKAQATAEGHAVYRQFVRRMAAIFTAATGLSPAGNLLGARRDFVHFMREVDAQLPQAARRPGNTDSVQAWTKAIQRALDTDEG